MKRAVAPVMFALAVAIAWQTLCWAFSIPQYLLPAPTEIAQDLTQHLGVLLYHSGVTLVEALIGFVIANTLAIIVAVLIAFVPRAEEAILPFAIALKTTPIVAMAPLLLLWLGTGMAPKVAAAALISFFPVLVNALKGFTALQEGEEDLFRVYGASQWQMLLKLRVLRAAPYIFSALKVSSSLSIVGAIVGEFVGANEGVGYIILVSSYHLESVRMFSALATSALAGVALYAGISYCDRRIVFWIPGSVDEVQLESPPRRWQESRVA